MTIIESIPGRTVVSVFLAVLSMASIAAALPASAMEPVAEASPRSAMQRAWIAEFSGHGSTVPEAGVRSSPVQRAAAADWLVRRLDALGLEPERHDYRQRNVNGLVDLLMPPLQGTNVYARIEATDPAAPVIVIGAHYDSDPGSPGAGDNASGVSLLLALARPLQGLENRAFNILLVFFDQEEDDEVGSKAFARFLQHRGLDVHSVHVTDLSGWDDDDDGVIEIQSPTPPLEALYRRAADRLGIPLRLSTGGSSDNKSFLAAGLPTVGVFGDVTRHLHQPTDTLETVDFEYLDRMTSLILAVVRELATEPRTHER